MERIGRYRVTRLLGEGGMGTVYAGYDDRLDRPVAIKVLRTDRHADARARERFGREARAAARVSHPNICPLYDFDDHDGEPFLVMELLEGEPLSQRLTRGALPLLEAVSLAVTMLDALAALHRRGVIHRDLKPANVFLTPHGLKLLDFGLAQPSVAEEMTGAMALTGHGVIIGTPQYMAPEQLQGQPADERADLFAAAAVIYEMLAGRPPFTGRTLADLVHAVVYTDPAPLPPSPGLASLDRALRRALVKDPKARLARGDALASLIQAATLETEAPGPPAPRPGTRIVALPLRVLRQDPDTDFLAFSVPDAVSAGLANIQSVTVRSAPAQAPGAIDPMAIGRDMAVDVVLTGTILRAGGHVRVSAQLTDTAAGTLIWSDTVQAPIDDLFQLQDTITERIVSSLALPLTAGDRQALVRQAPASAEAYELFMRANQLMTDTRQWDSARALYEQAVAIDPDYAPAWVGLARVRRVLAKWGGAEGVGLLPQAETALRRALELNPDLASAYDLSAYVDVELGHAPDAMVRLLRRAAMGRADAGLFAGLVTTCRYAGLLEASLAAHRRAQALDPALPTSVAWTHFQLGDYQSAVATERSSLPYATLMARLMQGTLTREMVHGAEAQAGGAGNRAAIAAYRHILEGDVAAVHADLEVLREAGFADPEGWYLYGLGLALTGEWEPARELLARALDGGYACYVALTRLPEWRRFADAPGFDALLARSGSLVTRARRMYEEAGGPIVLGVM